MKDNKSFKKVVKELKDIAKELDLLYTLEHTKKPIPIKQHTWFRGYVGKRVEPLDDAWAKARHSTYEQLQEHKQKKRKIQTLK